MSDIRALNGNGKSVDVQEGTTILRAAKLAEAFKVTF